MNFHKTEKFLEKILSYVKFPFDKGEIRAELKDHMMDKMEYYIEAGYDDEEAEKLTIEDMGDSKIIGVELNKQHNPILGWIWIITNMAVTLFVAINIFILGTIMITTIFSTNYIGRIPKDNILYRIDLNERVQIDDRVIKFTNLIYEKDGNMNIFYKDYEKRFFGGGWNFSGIGIVRDELGNEYYPSSGSGGGGLIISKWIKTIKDFPQEANTLIIDYDRYNRKYKVEIPLKVGENNE